MNNSILLDVKKILGIDGLNTDFDQDLIIFINASLLILNQMGIGKDNFRIESSTSKWSDFLLTELYLDAVQPWVALKVRTMFDPPTSSIVNEALSANLKELEWRIYITKNYVGEI